MSHSLASLVRGSQDLPTLRYLLCDPDPEQRRRFRAQARACHAAARTHQVLLDGAYVALGDMAAWLLYPEDPIYSQHDAPRVRLGLAHAPDRASSTRRWT